MGSLLPYMTIWLQHRGLSDVRIGYVSSAFSLAVLFTPLIITFLADAHIGARQLLMAVFALSGIVLAALSGAHSFWLILLLWTVHGLALAPITALQDGLFFSAQRELLAMDGVAPPYHRVRVWGSFGFIVPSVVLFFLLQREDSIDMMLFAATACCFLGAINALSLPNAPPRAEAGQLPTAGAFRAMLQPQVIVFCAAIWLVHLACAAFYTFSPIYLTKLVGVPVHWVGMFFNIGVAVEIAFMLGYAAIIRAIGLRGLLIFGALSMAARFALMAMFPVMASAVGTQLFHGMMVLVVHVAPPVFLDRHARPEFRNSMQGLFLMMIAGTGRVIGGAISGHIAQWSVTGLFHVAAGLSIAAAVLLIVAFREPVTGEQSARANA